MAKLVTQQLSFGLQRPPARLGCSSLQPYTSGRAVQFVYRDGTGGVAAQFMSIEMAWLLSPRGGVAAQLTFREMAWLLNLQGSQKYIDQTHEHMTAAPTVNRYTKI